MERSQTVALLDDLWATYHQAVEALGNLTNEQLDGRVQAFGGREVPIRNILYQMMTHAREHTVHLTKVLQETGATGAQPTEAQLILNQVGEALGQFTGLFARTSDEDLDREFEEQSLRRVLEHVKDTIAGYQRRIVGGLGG